MGDFFIQPDECNQQAENLKQVKAKLERARQQIAELRKEISRTQTDETLSRALQSVEDELKSQENAAEAMGTALITIVGLYKKTDGGLEFKEQYLSAKPKNQKTDSDSLDQWLDSDYKLTKEEKKKAKDMLDDYFAEGTTARKLLDENNPNYVMVLRNSMSNAELEQYQKMIALRNKTGFLSSITAGILGGTFLGSLQDMLTEYLSKPEGYTFLDTSKSSSLYANSLSQHKLGTLTGAFAANVALWELGSEALGGICKTLKGGGKVAEGTIETGSKAAENVIESLGKSSDDLIKELEKSIKQHPLRQEYENAVKELSNYEIQLSAQGLSEKSIAELMYQARRDLGVKYKDLTPDLLRKYIYEVNEARYGDPLGGSFEFFENKYKGNFSKIIEASKRPNADVDKLLSKFKEWLDSQ